MFLLTAYGMPHVMGYLATKGGQAHPKPLDTVGLMDAAVDLGLAGIEIPLARRVPSFEGKYVDVEEPESDLRAALQERNLELVADYGVLIDHPAEHFIDYLKLAQRTGANVVRATLSTVLCGDRRNLPGGWDARLQAIADRLKEILPAAEDLGMAVGMENHQDATSDDLIRLHEMSGFSSAYGITLDTGNPLAVGEGPVEFARKIAPLVRHVHLKDYTIHFAPEGYRLVRCAAGDGSIDFPAILDIVRNNGHGVIPGIEVAAQPTRTIPLLEDDWWSCYPSAQVANLPQALRVLWKHGRPADEPYSSAWERGEDSTTVDAEEWGVVRRSAAYFKSLVSAEDAVT